MNRMGKEFLAKESGAVAVIVVLLLTVFCGFAALAIDYGHLLYVKRELTKAAEAGALSGARSLWPLNLSTATYEDRLNPKYSVAETTAITTADNNLPKPTTDVINSVAGRWNYNNKTFDTANKANANGVLVTIRRDNVPTFFSQIIYQNPINIQCYAAAVCDFSVSGGFMPIAIGQDQNAPLEVGKQFAITFKPSPSDTGCWFLKDTAPNTNDLITEMNKTEGTASPLYVGDTINLDNGELNKALEALETKWENAPKPFLASVPVVDNAKFVDNKAPIITFVQVEINFVNAAPWDDKGDKVARIEATVQAVGLLSSGVPGSNPGAGSGLLAPPKLVPYTPPVP